MRATRAGRRITPERGQTDNEAESDETEEGPFRRCIVTRERLEKPRMIRFVVGPDRQLVPDLAARLPGRGIWLSAQGDVIETARVRGAFAKAARGPVTVPPDLLSVLTAALARRIGEQLGLARRGGQAVAGFGKVREWVQTRRAALIVQASDGSAEERSRLLSGWPGPVVTPLTAAQLGGVFGRDHAVHAAVVAGRLAERIVADSARLAGLAAPQPGPAQAGGGAGRRRDEMMPHGVAGRDEGKVQAGR